MRVENKQTIIRNGSTALSIGAIVVAVFGLMIFMPLLQQILRSTLNTDAKIVILALYLLTVIGMFGILLWQGRKGTTEVSVKGNRSSSNVGGRDALRGITTAQLSEPTQPPASVTDHTTKTLDKVPFRER